MDDTLAWHAHMLDARAQAPTSTHPPIHPFGFLNSQLTFKQFKKPQRLSTLILPDTTFSTTPTPLN